MNLINIRHAEMLLSISFEMLEVELSNTWAPPPPRFWNEHSKHVMRIKRAIDSIKYARKMLEENLP